MNLPYLVLSDTKGDIFEAPEFLMTGMSLDNPKLPDENSIIELPFGSNLFMLPDRIAIGYDRKANRFVEINEYKGIRVFPVAAFMAPAYLQILGSAFITPRNSKRLSLYSYSASGWKNGKFYSCGIRIDDDVRQDMEYIDLDEVDRKKIRILEKYPDNRLVRHLVDNCVTCYGCPAARNFVLSRWECPVPTSIGCNSGCIGCISKQPPETDVTASQNRISFTPNVKEIMEFTVPHLKNAQRAVISFGQGCEGEPLLAGNVIGESIKAIRKITDRGIININTNASKPEIIERLCRAGLDSIRVSINSFRESFYNAYYRPRDYSFEDVMESIKIVNKYRRWISINYLIFPGFTDSLSEIESLKKILNSFKISMIQTRNLNIDPDWYMEELRLRGSTNDCIGIMNWINLIRNEFPGIKLGYFNPPREEMIKFGYYTHN